MYRGNYGGKKIGFRFQSTCSNPMRAIDVQQCNSNPSEDCSICEYNRHGTVRKGGEASK